ncbi:MAG: 4-(cytidine 5'-diphospho)-2-C-methyl-D-erythritol kinase [Chlamydiia bacterium]|nr:4-(cytidine 5'-diphospho)-2-C-methyl-D-erythritol kinase [Chlamydiia bacterium]
MQLLSPAKVNLSLRILGKREDGYHEIDTRIQAVSLFDTLELALAKSDSFTCSDPFLSDKNSNLAWRAVEAFRLKAKINEPLHLHLEKKIPYQAGLGGGSGNAATALFAMNKLFNALLSPEELLTLGASLGSDVPFFFSCGSARCRGRGEKVEEVEPFTERLTIVKPPLSLSTSDVYAALKLSSNASGLHQNDLEAAAFEVLPDLFAFKEKLKKSGFHTVNLCGSGSAFYCLGDGDSTLGVQVIPARRTKDNWYS